MPSYEIPGKGALHVSALVLDLNGTVAIDGEIIPGVAERVRALQKQGMTVKCSRRQPSALRCSRPRAWP
jgi:soluble P-type ATPase